MKHFWDWSAYETAGQGDVYASIPATGGDFAKAVAVCIGDKQCQRKPQGVMCPSFIREGAERNAQHVAPLLLRCTQGENTMLTGAMLGLMEQLSEHHCPHRRMQRTRILRQIERTENVIDPARLCLNSDLR